MSGSLPDPHIMANGEKLQDKRPKPGICELLHRLEGLHFVDFVSTYLRRTLVRDHRHIFKHPGAAEFPQLPVEGYNLKFQINFDPNYKQQCHLESLKVSRDISAAIEAKTTLRETAAMNRGLDLKVFNADIRFSSHNGHQANIYGQDGRFASVYGQDGRPASVSRLRSSRRARSTPLLFPVSLLFLLPTRGHQFTIISFSWHTQSHIILDYISHNSPSRNQSHTQTQFPISDIL
ncbi:hypothetical protein DPX16_1035 [Anabarilius grahami]|uniref:Uncharacterized protein n=1 Tax=Anabarilius grahami TaxID=495550 RepID=A0A3N0XS99_ANAGA|nr:hypothetical protein DPX16_1035 [Anabarilius grahami]